MLDRRTRLWDSLGEVKDSYAVAASALASVDSVAKIFDTGGGYTEGLCEIYVSVCTNETGSSHVIAIEGSASATFATPTVELANLNLSSQLANIRASRAQTTGFYILPFSNDFAGTVYRYLRIYTTVTSTGSVTFTAQFCKPIK